MNLFLGIITLLVIWLLALTFVLVRVLIHYQKLTRGVKGSSLVRVWEENLKKVQANEREIEAFKNSLNQLRLENLTHLQKVGVVRFNPFHEIGGNQSFAVALLDELGNGLVVSTLHGRDSSRAYAKPVKNFEKVEFELSKEEKDAISIARHPES